MIAIIITEENKAANNLSNAIGSIMTRSDYPNAWNGVQNVVGGYPSLTGLHSQDGWAGVVNPTIGANQKRGAIYYDEADGYFTYEVIDKTEEELQQEQISASEATKEQRVKEISDSLVLKGVYNETDIQTVLDNLDLYPMFEVGIPVFNKLIRPMEYLTDAKTLTMKVSWYYGRRYKAIQHNLTGIQKKCQLCLNVLL